MGIEMEEVNEFISAVIIDRENNKKYVVKVSISLSGECFGTFENAKICVQINGKVIRFEAACEWSCPVYLNDDPENIMAAKSLPFNIYEAARTAAQSALHTLSVVRESGVYAIPGFYDLDDGNGWRFMLERGTDNDDFEAKITPVRSDGEQVLTAEAFMLYDYETIIENCTNVYGEVNEDELREYKQIERTRYCYSLSSCPECFRKLMERMPEELSTICITCLKLRRGISEADAAGEFRAVYSLSLRPLGLTVI